MHQIIIIGGGLAGLVNSILLSRAGLSVLLLEKNSYPFHRVCGEYISNEVIPFLEKHDIFPSELNPSRIDQLTLSSVSGRSFHMPLDLGGFGVSRYNFDQWLVEKARQSGVQILEQTRAQEVTFANGLFTITTDKDDQFVSQLVIAAHGKRAKLDQTLNRSFIQKKSPYVGVKYHVTTDLPSNEIALHNFRGGYCGVSKVDGNRFNICYMTERKAMRENGGVKGLEQQVLYKNPLLKSLFQNSEFLLKKPEVINEISFEQKEPVYDHMLMTGDAAGMITPLCGNGMAMAIHSASILSGIILDHLQKDQFDLPSIEAAYTKMWNAKFATRLWAGRKIQTLFGNGIASELAIFTGKAFRPIARGLMRQTHGVPFS